MLEVVDCGAHHLAVAHLARAAAYVRRRGCSSDSSKSLLIASSEGRSAPGPRVRVATARASSGLALLSAHSESTLAMFPSSSVTSIGDETDQPQGERRMYQVSGARRPQEVAA